MDPNETLKRIRAIIDDYNADEDGMMDATERDEMFTELVTLLEALDEWMSKGGFSPWGDPRGDPDWYPGRFGPDPMRERFPTE